ncbi:MAG: argininosuccinate synthase [Verrucomicrobiales bacterium]
MTKGMIDIAKQEGATSLAHGATGKGNDQVRFELSAASLAPDMEMIAPWRMAEFREQFPGRAEMISYAEKEGIPVQASASKPYSMDRNLLHISFESGILEDPWFDGSIDELKSMYVLSVSPEDAPDAAEYIQILFEKGNIVGLQFDGIEEAITDHKLKSLGTKGDYQILSPYSVMILLNMIGGRNGIGRIDMVENRFVGMKSRGIYETPGGAILFDAHRIMESLTMDREVMHIRDSLIPKYSELVYNGFWFSPEREAIQSLVLESQKNVSGEVRLKLYKGNVISAGVKSQLSLYNEDIATMEGGAEEAYNQDDATGFIRLNGLRLKTHSRNQPEDL